ncbi:MAG: NAD(P)-binding domain-containing protein [Pseudomonadota bacterium]|nr:NAD(P)-binding domain-containing protein [Pseudomonadota bacterium]
MTEHPKANQRCGVIGLGMIGAGIAICLARKGHEVYGYDVRPEVLADLASVSTCNSPAEVARRAGVVIVSVVTATQAREVLFGSQGIAEGAQPGIVVALMCTIRIPLVLEMAQEAAAMGIKLIDVAITTGAAPTANGTSGLMVGGDAQTVESVRNVMEDFSSIYSHMGPIGAGMAAKVARNVMHYNAWVGAYEGGLLAEAAGVDIHKLVEVIRKSDPNNIMGTALLEKRGVQPLTQAREPELLRDCRAGANLQAKDLDAGIDLAENLGVDVPGARLAMQRCNLIWGIPDAANDADAYQRGRAAMDEVYGKGTVQMPETIGLSPLNDATLRILFGEIWRRAGLSIRDRRMLVLGATAQMNRPELIEIQVMGALKNRELSEQQLQEAVLHLAFYCGFGKATAVSQGVNAALKKFAESTRTKPKSE